MDIEMMTAPYFGKELGDLSQSMRIQTDSNGQRVRERMILSP
jgi:hypothetical protein